MAQRHRHADAYVEFDQAATADLTSDDAVTYTQVAAGVEAGIDTARTHGGVSARYERQVAEIRRSGGADEVTGLARASYRVARPLTVEGGALATRTRVDIRWAAPAIADVALPGVHQADNTTQLYSVYAGPTFSTGVGPVALSAAYRFGYTKVDASISAVLRAGVPRQDYFGSAIDRSVTAAAAIAPGRVLPVGITLSGSWTHDAASQLGQRLDDRFGRSDVVLPLSGTFAVTGGVGYEHLQVTQRDPVVAADGTPVLGADGRFETNDASAPRLAYLTDGLIYDAGVLWRPSPRTRLTATVAHEYGSTTYTGAFDWRVERTVAFHADAYDAVETFGHQLSTGLQAPPTDSVDQGGLGSPASGCAFSAGDAGNGGGAGECLNPVLQSITKASYRARGVDAILSATSGRNRYGIGAGYANRHLFSPRGAPGLVVDGVDDSWFVQGFYGRQLGRRSSLDVNAFAEWYDSALSGASGVFSAGAAAAYLRSFGRLGAVAQLGLYTYDGRALDDQWVTQGLVGARYDF